MGGDWPEVMTRQVQQNWGASGGAGLGLVALTCLSVRLVCRGLQAKVVRCGLVVWLNGREAERCQRVGWVTRLLIKGGTKGTAKGQRWRQGGPGDVT